MAFLQTAASAYAHGRVTSITAEGESYDGFLNEYIYTASPPDIVAWSAANGDNGFVDPTLYTSGDIICHHNGTAGKIAAKVAAGDKIEIQWGPDAWPESHHGPVIDYLAKCAGDDCTTVDKETLEFFKIDEAGLIDGTTAPGTWASDELIAADGKWSVTIPESLAPGQYVLRHEIIALHSAGDENGAQNYPQCFNLEVTGSGTASPSGVLGTALYTPTDAGIKVGIYSPMSSYEIPGPALWDGASSGSSGASTGNSTSGSASSSGSASNSTVAVTSSAAAVQAVATSAASSQASATQSATATITSAAAAVSEIADSLPSAALTSTISTELPTPTGTETDADMPSKALPEGFTLADLLEWVNYLLSKAFTDNIHARALMRF